VAEESGIGDLEFAWGESWHETPRYGRHGKVARYYLGRTRSGEVCLGVNPELGRPEHDEYRWVDALEARRLLNERVRAALEWALAQMGFN